MLAIKVFLDNKLLHKTSFSSDEISLGRSLDNDLVLPDNMVSRHHAIIEKKGLQYLIKDTSTNGTFLENAPLEKALVMSPDCTIQIHPFVLRCTIQTDDVTAPLILPTPSEEEISDPPYSTPDPQLQPLHFGLLVGEDPYMHHIYQTIRRVADSPASILVAGESGTGKELIAKAIHGVSPRKDAPFVALDCAAIPDTLIESELFGFEKGAFTGATSAKKGWIEEAQGGTVFLDEVGELTAAAQAKLLRFIQDRTFARLGGTRTLQADVRFITATNKDLGEAVRRNQFRLDLYFRLRVIQINLPPLRARKKDLPLLIDHIISKAVDDLYLSQIPTLTERAFLKLQGYHWPGNIRQLENVLYEAIVRIRPPYLIDESNLDISFDLKSPSPTFHEINRQFLLATLQDCNWNTSKAAEKLRVSRGTIYYKSKKLGINIRELSR